MRLCILAALKDFAERSRLSEVICRGSGGAEFNNLGKFNAGYERWLQSIKLTESRGSSAALSFQSVQLCCINSQWAARITTAPAAVKQSAERFHDMSL